MGGDELRTVEDVTVIGPARIAHLGIGVPEWSWCKTGSSRCSTTQRPDKWHGTSIGILDIQINDNSTCPPVRAYSKHPLPINMVILPRPMRQRSHFPAIMPCYEASGTPQSQPPKLLNEMPLPQLQTFDILGQVTQVTRVCT